MLSLGQFASAEEQTARRSFDRDRLPRALRDVPLERLSSGALLRLDRDGDLVEPPQEWNARLQARTPQREVTTDALIESETIPNLDPRVGSNIRLGDDPAALPSNRRAQAEPHIARAPNDSDFLLATFQEGRFGNGGAADCGYAVSHDGGLTWTRALIPNVAQPGGGTFERATDPVAGIDAAGNAYLNVLGLRTGLDSEGDSNLLGVVLVSRSTNGGASFAPPFIAYQAPNNDIFPDKNWMAINSFPGTSSAGRIVVTFTLFSNLDKPGNNHPEHPILRVYSDDQCATWSGAAAVHAANQQVQGSQPVFLPDGRFAIVYWDFNFTDAFDNDFLALVVSNDGGVTFGPPKFITTVAIHDQPMIRDAIFLPSATTDRTASSIYVVYQARHNGSPRIMFTKSTNAGDSWSAPIPISDNPAGSGVFNPAISASPDGQTLTASFYDLRDNPGASTLVDMYLAQSFDGGATWQPNLRLTSTSSDASLAVNTGSATQPNYMLGDYLGVAPTTNPQVPAVPVWVDTRTGNPDPFVARVGIASSYNFASWRAAHFSLGQVNNPSISGETADPDGDGEDNLTEFGFRTDPTNAASVPNTAAQLNISTRARVEATDENILIGGFIIQGSVPKRVIVRAIGPSLAARGIADALQNPTLELVPAGGPSVFNDDWRDTDAANIEATGFAPTDDREAAIVLTLAPGAYTALVRGRDNSTGVALVEIYDLTPANGSQLRNLSSRARVNVGDNIMIGGVIIGAGHGPDGAGNARVLLRAVGPSLSAQGITNPLLDPEVFLVNANGDVIAENNNWRDTQQAEIQATGLAPSDIREAAIVTVLPRGAYTALVRGVGGTTGVGLVELYHVDPLTAQTFSFEENLQGWSAKATDVDHPSVEWSITPSKDRASDGDTSLKFTLNNLNDAGKIWIERPFAVRPNTTYAVNVKFSFATADFGDLNHWTLIAGVTPQPAQTRTDLSYRGSTANGESSNTGYRWLEKSYTFTATSGPEGNLYVQLGVWGTYEVERTYYFDRVRIAIQEL